MPKLVAEWRGASRFATSPAGCGPLCRAPRATGPTAPPAKQGRASGGMSAPEATCTPTYLPTYILTYLLAVVLACSPFCLPTCWPTRRSVCLFAHPLAYLLAYLLDCLPTCPGCSLIVLLEHEQVTFLFSSTGNRDREQGQWWKIYLSFLIGQPAQVHSHMLTHTTHTHTHAGTTARTDKVKKGLAHAPPRIGQVLTRRRAFASALRCATKGHVLGKLSSTQPAQYHSADG